MIIHLEPWVEGKQYDRLGMLDEYTNDFDKLAKYGEVYSKLTSLKNEISSLK